MHIVVFGTGFVGSALVRELAGRGHQVTAVSRKPNPALPQSITQASDSVHNSGFVKTVTASADVIVAALPPDEDFPKAIATLINTAEQTSARLGVVGGSAVLPLREGEPRQADTPGFPDWLIPRTEAHEQALIALNAAPAGVDWFCLIPAAEFGPHRPGVRTGSYRTSTSAQVTDNNGRSSLGVEDFALAFADELDKPRTHRAWRAVGY